MTPKCHLPVVAVVSVDVVMHHRVGDENVAHDLPVFVQTGAGQR
jgi:hypothetical protein